MDNLAVHHYEGGEEYLANTGVKLIFTPTQSPDLNPVEPSFNKVKCLLNGRLADAMKENLKITVGEAFEAVSSTDAKHFYSATSYLFPAI